MKLSSSIDYPRPNLPLPLWDIARDPPVLRDIVRQSIINNLISVMGEQGYDRPLRFIRSLILSGSSATNVGAEDCDVDVDVVFDLDDLRSEFHELVPLLDKDLISHLRKIIYSINGKKVSGTQHPFSFMVLEPGDKPAGDNLYDILGNKWIKGPVLIPLDFDPDKAFIQQKITATKIGRWVDQIVGTILQILEDLEVLDQYQRNYDGKMAYRVMILTKLRNWCNSLDKAYNYIWGLQKDAKSAKGGPQYLYFDYSPNWDERMIVFKYLARARYHMCIYDLYKKLEGNPYLEVIDRFIPD